MTTAKSRKSPVARNLRVGPTCACNFFVNDRLLLGGRREGQLPVRQPHRVDVRKHGKRVDPERHAAKRALRWVITSSAVGMGSLINPQLLHLRGKGPRRDAEEVRGRGAGVG